MMQAISLLWSTISCNTQRWGPSPQVLFADMHWVGLKEENPEETPLEMPEALQAEIERVDVSGAHGSSCTRPTFVAVAIPCVLQTTLPVSLAACNTLNLAA